MAQFYDLTVTDIHKTIRDAVVVTLKPSEPRTFDFIPGQYLTFKAKAFQHPRLYGSQWLDQSGC